MYARHWATLKAGHDLIMGGQHIDHLAFSFVAPLQTENDIDFFHLFSVICFMQKTFFAFKDTNYSPKYPIPLRDFSTNCQESGVAGALPTGTRNPLSLQSKGRKSRVRLHSGSRRFRLRNRAAARRAHIRSERRLRRQ